MLQRHLSTAKEWFPHELIPWSQGRDYPRRDGQAGPAPSQPPGAGPVSGAPMSPGVASAIWVNLLTEDNLPHYFHAIADTFGEESAMGEWSRRWAAEEQRHSIVLRDWVCVTRCVDPVDLERARMHQLCTGFGSSARNLSIVDGLVYLALQELATRISHRNTAKCLGDEVATTIMNRVAADENLHYLFYRDLVSTAIAEDPSAAVRAIERQVTTFEMPGAGIEGFAAHAAAIAAAGIYDFGVHYRHILVPVVLRHWALESIEGLDAEAEAARDRTLRWIARMGRVADRLAAQAAASVPAPPGVASGAGSAEVLAGTVTAP